MEWKKLRKSSARFWAWISLRCCSLIIKVIPAQSLYGLAQGLGNFGYLVVGKLRRLALDSLGVAFAQEKPPGELKQIARQCFIYMAKSSLELMFLMDRPALLKARVKFIGQENLSSALSRGKGVILVSAHFGNFPLLMAKLSLEGFPISGIMRPMHDTRAEEFFLALRNRIGVKTIYSQPRQVCVQNTLAALRQNELVFIPIDQNFGTGGVFVDFFGRKAATATGPVVLARRTQAVIIPCFIIRQADDTHKVIFEPPLDLIDGKTPEETIRINIQRLTGIIEAYIRRHPAEWGWIHRRWKSQLQA